MKYDLGNPRSESFGQKTGQLFHFLPTKIHALSKPLKRTLLLAHIFGTLLYPKKVRKTMNEIGKIFYRLEYSLKTCE